MLFVLDRVLRSGTPRPGDYGVLLALGPGFAAEAALLRWQHELLERRAS